MGHATTPPDTINVPRTRSPAESRDLTPGDFALCGVEVIPASLTAAPEGGYCRSCTAIPHPEDHAVTGAAAPKPPVVPDAPHGTLRGYSLGCRCCFCESAKAATVPPASDTAGTGKGPTR
ncbi:MAG: hypothetical protein ACRDS0_10095 [Pseudonocardiaceae bacterium]